MVIGLNNAASQRQAQAPSATLGCEAGIEDAPTMARSDTPPRIGYIDKGDMPPMLYGNGDFSLPLHGIDGILHEVLYNPAPQSRDKHNRQRLRGEVVKEGDPTANARGNIASGGSDLFGKVASFEMGFRPYFLESVRNGL